MLLSIQHQKGGTTKSTIAWNLSISLSSILKNIKIEVVDLDIQQTLTLNNYIRGEDKSLKKLNIRTFVDVEKLQEYFNTDNDNKIIIVDTGGFDSALNRITAMASDYMITPVSDSGIDIQGLKTYEKVLKQLTQATGDVIHSKVLLSAIDPRKRNLDEIRVFIEQSEHFSMFDTVIRRRTDYINSICSGKSVIEYNSDSKASEEILALSYEVIKMMAL